MTTETFINVEGNLVPANQQPPYPELQDAFRMSRGKIVIDMPAAREIAREAIRQARKPLFDANDAATIRAMQRGEPTAPQLARGDKLRAAPQDPRIDAATTPDALRLAIDAVLTDLGS